TLYRSFKHGVSKRVFSYLKSYTEIRLARLLRTRYRRLRWKDINRRYVNNHGVIVAEGMVMFNPAAVPVTRYRYRGTKIPTPWASAAPAVSLAGSCGEPVAL